MKFDPSAYVGFDWDAGNASKSQTKHRVNVDEAEQVFLNEPLVVLEDTRHSQIEKRYHALGQSDHGRLLQITFTLRSDKIRIISARPMSPKERKFYENQR